MGEGFHPAVVIVGPLTQDFFADGVEAVDVAEKVHDVLGACEQGHMTEDDDTVETVVYQGQQAAKQLCEGRKSKHPTTGPEREERVQGRETAGFVPLLSSRIRTAKKSPA